MLREVPNLSCENARLFQNRLISRPQQQSIKPDTGPVQQHRLQDLTLALTWGLKDLEIQKPALPSDRCRQCSGCQASPHYLHLLACPFPPISSRLYYAQYLEKIIFSEKALRVQFLQKVYGFTIIRKFLWGNGRAPMGNKHRKSKLCKF